MLDHCLVMCFWAHKSGGRTGQAARASRRVGRTGSEYFLGFFDHRWWPKLSNPCKYRGAVTLPFRNARFNAWLHSEYTILHIKMDSKQKAYNLSSICLLLLLCCCVQPHDIYTAIKPRSFTHNRTRPSLNPLSFTKSHHSTIALRLKFTR